MKKSILMLISLILTIQVCYSQCTQKQANKLFSIATFLSFVENFEKSEAKLLTWDFCLVGEVAGKMKGIKYFEYRLNHTANIETEKYDFDRFIITNDAKQFEYSTSSGKNFNHYKSKLFEFGFIKLEENFNGEEIYIKKTNKGTYMLHFERNVHSSGSPNYWIYLGFGEGQ